MRKAAALVLLLATVAPAAASAAAKPRVRTITVGGRVLNADGSPASRVRVSLVKNPGFFDALVGLFSAGLACVATDICSGSNVRTSTGADGRWKLQLVRSGRLARDSDVAYTVGSPRGASTAAEVTFNRRGRRLPDLRLYPGALSVTQAPAAHEIVPTYDPLPPEAGAEPDYAVSAQDAKGRATYTSRSTFSGDPIDDRLVETGNRALVVTATAELDGYGEVRYTGAPAALGDLPVPISRGVAVKRLKEKGGYSRRVPAWTDGDLVTEIGEAGSTGDRAIVVDLGSPRPVSAVVVHGCTFDCAVALSDDNRTYTPFADSDSGGSVRLLTAAVPVTARYVRYTSEFSIDFTTAAEISVF